MSRMCESLPEAPATWRKVMAVLTITAVCVVSLIVIGATH